MLFSFVRIDEWPFLQYSLESSIFCRPNLIFSLEPTVLSVLLLFQKSLKCTNLQRQVLVGQTEIYWMPSIVSLSRVFCQKNWPVVIIRSRWCTITETHLKHCYFLFFFFKTLNLNLISKLTVYCSNKLHSRIRRRVSLTRGKVTLSSYVISLCATPSVMSFYLLWQFRKTSEYSSSRYKVA